MCRPFSFVVSSLPCLHSFWHAILHLFVNVYTYGPGAPRVVQAVTYTRMVHRRGKVEAVNVVVDHPCCPAPPWAMVYVIIMTRFVRVSETEMETVVASIPFAVVRDGIVIAAVLLCFVQCVSWSSTVL